MKKNLILILLCIILCSCKANYKVNNNANFKKTYSKDAIKGKFTLVNSFIINNNETHKIENLTNDLFSIDDDISYCYENSDVCYNLKYTLEGDNKEYIAVYNNEDVSFYKIIDLSNNKLITALENGTYKIYYFFERNTYEK